MPLVLWLRGGEGRGEDGEKVKRKKNCIHPQSMFTSAPFPPPPLLPSFPTFAATLAPFPSPLFLPLLHPRPFPPPPFADQNQLSPSFLLELFSPPHSFYFSLSAIVFFFFPPFLSDQKNSSHPDTHFHTQFLCVHTCLCASFFVGCIFIQVNFSSSRVNRSAFIRTCMRCFYKCVCVCV